MPPLRVNGARRSRSGDRRLGQARVVWAGPARRSIFPCVRTVVLPIPPGSFRDSASTSRCYPAFVGTGQRSEDARFARSYLIRSQLNLGVKRLSNSYLSSVIKGRHSLNPGRFDRTRRGFQVRRLLRCSCRSRRRAVLAIAYGRNLRTISAELLIPIQGGRQSRRVQP